MPFPNLVESLSQTWPSKPTFTESDVPDLRGKVVLVSLQISGVYFVTGANTGLGKHVARILYSKNAKVYVTARSEEKGQDAIEAIKASAPESQGELVFLLLDMADLSSIKAAAQPFLDSESRLHALFNNAGVMNPPDGSKTAQGYELQLGVNNLATFLLTKLLTPTLIATAQAEGAGHARVIWLASWAAEAPLVPSGGPPLDNLDYHEDKNTNYKYAVSKTGDYFYGVEYARRHRDDGVLSVPINPGNLNTELWRTQPAVMRSLLRAVFLHPSVYGAYTELFAAFSPEVTMERSGSWIVPWGRFAEIRKDLAEAAAPVSKGGQGMAEKFWEWTEAQVKPYL